MALKDVKKMCSKFCNGNSSNIVGYTPPTLHKGVRWFVDFTSLDLARGLMRRKRYYIKDSLSASEKKRRASEIMDVLTKQLAQGWNPWVTDDESRGFVYFDNCLERYLDYVDRMDRKKTRQSYRSRVNILREFITSQVNPIKYAYQFDIGFCNDFIDWIYLDRESSPRTRNNYRGWLYGLAEFLIARKHINTNPVEHIKVMPEHEKYRKDLTPEMLKQMSNYLCKNDKSFFLACLMQYYTLIRPGELSHLKIGDISLKKQTVFVSHEFSKNHKDAEVGLNKIVIKLMLDLEVFKQPDSYYLFGSDFKPSKERIGSDQFNKRWKVMRKALKWNDCYQFYSLKDSGIRDLANAQGVVVARDQARHSDITTTNKYIQKLGVQQVTLGFEGKCLFLCGQQPSASSPVTLRFICTFFGENNLNQKKTFSNTVPTAPMPSTPSTSAARSFHCMIYTQFAIGGVR